MTQLLNNQGERLKSWKASANSPSQYLCMWDRGRPRDICQFHFRLRHEVSQPPLIMAGRSVGGRSDNRADPSEQSRSSIVRFMGYYFPSNSLVFNQKRIYLGWVALVSQLNTNLSKYNAFCEIGIYLISNNPFSVKHWKPLPRQPQRTLLAFLGQPKQNVAAARLD